MQLYPGWSARDNYGLKKKRQSTGHTPVLNNSQKKAPRENNSMVNSPGHLNHGSPHRFAQGHHLINSPRMNSSKNSMQLDTGKSMRDADEQTRHLLSFDSDCLNQKKCRARFGLEGQSQWCKHCRRKKKCTRFLEDDPPNHLMSNYHGSAMNNHGTSAGSNGNPSSLSSPTTIRSEDEDSINEPDSDDILSRQIDSIEDDDDEEDDDDDDNNNGHQTNDDDDSDEENKQQHHHHHQPLSLVHKPIPSKLDSHHSLPPSQLHPPQHHFQPPPPAHLYQPSMIPSHFAPPGFRY